MGERTIATRVVLALLEFAVRKGARRSALLSEARLVASDLHDADGRVPVSRYQALMCAAKRLTGIHAFALQFGVAFDLSDLSLVGVIGAAAPNFMAALRELNRFASLVIETGCEPGERFRIEQDARGLWVVDLRPDPNAFPELTESVFGRMAAAARSFGETLRRVEVTHADPGYAAEYERALGAPTTFGNRRNAVLINPTWQTRPIARHPGYLGELAAARADMMLRDLAAAGGVRRLVEGRLNRFATRGEIGMAHLAASIGMSRWTLARRLRREGVTYEQVVAEWRRDRAIHFLCLEKLSVGDTASLLGYSEPAAFSRAFLRWTGKSPRAAAREAKPDIR